MAGDAGAGGSGGGGGGGGRRRARDEYSGELDAQEVANGFGMGMSSKVQACSVVHRATLIVRAVLCCAAWFVCPFFAL